MKKIFFSLLGTLLILSTFAQSKYSGVGGIETPYKGKYTFTVKMDEKLKKLIVETNAPVTVMTLETYTPEELVLRKGIEYTNTYTKIGNKYSYDLKSPLLKNKEAYWVKVSIGNNGIPLGEYYFKKKTVSVASAPVEETPAIANGEEIKNAAGATVIKTNIKCAAGKTKVINALKEMEGVTDVKIDIVTGKLTITYSSDGTPYTTILSTINENGFDANGQKTTNATANPCNPKTSN
jgi:copper chaperone CopZ